MFYGIHRIRRYFDRLRGFPAMDATSPPDHDSPGTARSNVQRFLLLLGCTWVAVGLGAFVVLSVLLSFPANNYTQDIPPGLQYLGVVPVGIGIAHLITYFVGARREQQSG